MKNTGLLLALLLASASSLWAQQVKVEVLLNEKEFLIGEAIPLAVRIVNHSGQTIHFGQDPWVSYAVEAMDGFVVLKTGEPAMAHDFDIESSKMATQRTDIAPCFMISKGGGYKVTATVHIKEWGQEISSEPKHFEVIRGTKLWEQEFGIPQPASAPNEAPEVRKYSLQRAQYMKHMTLYLRITDTTEGKVFKVIQVGPIVSFAKPRAQLDAKNNLHLIYEDGARSYNYSVTTPDGNVTLRQTYSYTDTAPRLVLDDNTGRIMIHGGVRRVAATDLPAPTSKSYDSSPPKDN